MIYLPETSHAPTLENLEASLRRFVAKIYKSLIDQRYESYKNSDNKTTKKSLREEYPLPSIDIVPLSSSEGIEEFLSHFQMLREIKFKVIEPNSEMDASKMLGDVRKVLGTLKPDRTDVTVAGSNGLDTKAAKDVLVDATAGGLTTARLRGIDSEGNKITGNNDKYNFQAHIPEKPHPPRELASRLISVFDTLTDDGTLKVGKPTQRSQDRARELVQKIISESGVIRSDTE
jgi:hypothetical protein